MNFLQLCQAVRREAGISGNGPLTVIGQAGEMARVVGWVQEAWSEIQIKRQNWMWMRGSFSFETSADQFRYTSQEAGIASRFRRWDPDTFRIYQTSVGVGNEFDLPIIAYNPFLRTYMTGPQPAGSPVCYAIAPNLDLLLGPKPNGEYTVTGDYWKSMQLLAANEDIPEMPEEYHLLIVFTALEKYALYESAAEVLERSRRGILTWMGALENNQLPMVEMAEPLV